MLLSATISINQPHAKTNFQRTNLGAVGCTSIEEKLLHYDVIAIDEGQFFADVNPLLTLLGLAASGKHLIVAALDGTFERKPFARILELVPLAESVTKLSASSYDAALSQRTVDCKDLLLIGGPESYRLQTLLPHKFLALHKLALSKLHS
jgi:thymidine kinase